MNTFKKVLAWAIVIVSIIGILVCAVGIAGSWAINNQLTDSVLNLITRAESALTRVEDTLTLADAQLKQASATLTTVQEAVSKLGDRIEKNSPVLDRITQILQDELGPTVSKIRDAFAQIEERVQTLNSTIEFVNRLPGVQLSTLDIQLDGPRDKVNLVVDAVQQLQQNVADFRSGIVQNLAPFVEKLDTIAAFVTRLDQDVNDYLAKANQVQSALAAAKTNIPGLIDSVTLVISILFLWIIFAQIGLILVVRLYLKTGRMIWEFNPSRKTAEALPEAGS